MDKKSPPQLQVVIKALPALKREMKLPCELKMDNATERDRNYSDILPLIKTKKAKKKTVTFADNPAVFPAITTTNCADDDKTPISDATSGIVDLKSNKINHEKRKHNYTMQCELAFERISQNISRRQYSYFRPIDSAPPPLKKKEKLYKAFQLKLESSHSTELHHMSSFTMIQYSSLPIA